MLTTPELRPAGSSGDGPRRDGGSADRRRAAAAARRRRRRAPASRALPRAPELSLTTNGLRLPGLAAPLADAGLRRVNISLDTLDRDRFVALTRRDRLVDTLAGIAAAKAAGLRSGEDQHGAACAASTTTRRRRCCCGRWNRVCNCGSSSRCRWTRSTAGTATRMVTADEILEPAAGAGFALDPVAGRGSAPAEEWLVNGGPQTVGVVGSVTRPFCASCDRVRLTADGQWRSCLFARGETDLRTPLRAGADDGELAALMQREVRRQTRRATAWTSPGSCSPPGRCRR